MTAALTITVPNTAHEVAALQADAELELATWSEFSIDTAAEYEQVDTFLTGIVRRKDAALAMRTSATGPLYKSTKTIEGWFAPYLAALTALEGKLKAGMGTYRLAQQARERDARAEAARLASSGDSGAALVEALTVATEAAQPPAGRASVGFEWRVHRVADDLVTREWLCVDRARIDAYAKSWKGDEPPVIPGVVFERFAKIGARR
jgi:hypothetical protein